MNTSNISDPIIDNDYLSSTLPKKSVKVDILCYDLSSMLSKRHTLVLSNTRKLNRVSTTI